MSHMPMRWKKRMVRVKSRHLFAFSTITAWENTTKIMFTVCAMRVAYPYLSADKSKLCDEKSYAMCGRNP